MGYTFNESEIKRISKTFGLEPKRFADAWTWEFPAGEGLFPLFFTLYSGIDLGSGELGSLATVQSRQGYYELHGVESFMVFEPDEVFFVASGEAAMSCLIISKQGACSLYSNIDRNLLSGDPGSLHPGALLAAMQLSIVDNIEPENAG